MKLKVYEHVKGELKEKYIEVGFWSFMGCSICFFLLWDDYGGLCFNEFFYDDIGGR